MNNKSRDITGQTFHKWTALKELPELEKRGSKFYLCRCACGVEKPVNKYHLTNGTAKQCNHCSRGTDINGKIFGKFVVIGKSDKKNSKGITLWKCECQCGQIIYSPSTPLIQGKRTKCRKCTVEDLTGRRFGNQVVVSRCFKQRKWLVKCDCGQEKYKTSLSVKQSSSCGRCENVNRVGKKFGRLLILSIDGYDKKNQAIFKTQCDCGTIKNISASLIVTGSIRSCGCLRDLLYLKSAQKLIGLTIGFLKILKIIGYKSNSKRIVFLCKCKCGNFKEIEKSRLCDIKSCGCAVKEASPRGENHSFAKLTNKEAESIRALFKSKLYSQKQISLMFGLNESVISRVIHNKTYTEI